MNDVAGKTLWYVDAVSDWEDGVTPEDVFGAIGCLLVFDDEITALAHAARWGVRVIELGEGIGFIKRRTTDIEEASK